ncbi:MAG TPA: T9SS type A sorting domain-containing protein [Flavobacterium sp.]|uniref:T9SS type A sorting domain-containing protein n=1 Tax=Flavobacterium sp. TaxID=239 RepID=UPI002C69CA42|nr:T9SS type A sorting domain-containing protein [Flavobacterium sp.]HNP31807.1 T9SS type A sorting domain-containing protein [Flavobacterium sp.]
MKNVLQWQQLLCCILFIACNFPVLHSQEILWEKSYGGKHAEYLFDAIPTPDYGFILAGSSLSKKTGNKTDDNRGDLDYWVWKMDENGELDWQKSFGGSGQDLLYTVLLTNDGGFLLAGSSDSGKGFDKKDQGRGDSDFWIIKLNAKGGEEWQKTIGGFGQDELNSILKTKNGGFVLAGSSSSEKSGEKTSENFGGLDYWVMEINPQGEIIWQNSFGGIYNDELRSIALTQDGGYILGGSSNSPESGNKIDKSIGESDYWIVKLDEMGKQQWQKVIGGTGDDQLYVVHQMSSGNYILGGNSNSESDGDKTEGNESGTDFWLVALNKDQKMLWQKTFNIAKSDVLTSLVENNDHTILLGGYAQGEIERKNLNSLKKADLKKQTSADNDKMKKNTGDYIAVKINDKGEELWRKNVGSDGEDILKKVIETRDGDYLMTGTSKAIMNESGGVKASRDKSSGKGSNDFWVVKLKDKQKPKEPVKPVEAIPNPAINYTNVIVGYDYSKGTATLVDIAGHVLQTFPIKDKTIPIDLQGLPEGIYVVNIRTDVQNSGVKIIKSNNKN